MTNLEKRGGLLGVEVRAAEDGKRTLVGYAAVFNSDADIGGAWVERITPGAFSSAVGKDVLAFVNHDSSRVIGRTKSGTLRLSEDGHGLAVEIDVPNTTDGNDLWALVERGDISGMSIGFIVTKQEWDETTEPPTRTISKVDLFEVSATAMPAYQDTTIGKRSLEAAHLEAEAAKAEEDRKKENDMAAKRRIAERRARQEQKIRGIQSLEGDGQDAA
jgi:HK97 family phage prohead protease